MADNTNKTDTGSISKMDDTRTRKTLKLKPVKKSGSNAAVDPLTQRNTETGPLGVMADTRTRKTVKLRPQGGLSIEDVEKADLAPVVDPLTKRNTETGPLGPMVDTRTRKTVKLKSLRPKPPVEIDIASATPPADGEGGMLKETHTRKTLKLKVVKPGAEKPAVSMDSAAVATPGADGKSGMLKETHTRKTLKLKAVKPAVSMDSATAATPGADGKSGMLKETHTRKTLKLKAVRPGAEKLAVADAESTSKDAQETHTRKTLKLSASGKAAGLSAEDLTKPGEAESTDDDTIKIQRPKQKPGAMPMPSLGVTVAAKTVNNKDTVKLRPPAAGEAPAGEEVSQASKDTIKLSPHPVPEGEVSEDKKDDAPTVNLKVNAKKGKNSKLTIGKTPPPKTPVPKTPVPATVEGKFEESKPGSGGLKLKEMAPIAEAPRAKTDKDVIKEKKKAMKGGRTQASGFYTLLAVLTIVLVAFCALVTATQYFNLWDLETIGGQKIEIPYLNELMK